MSEPALESPSRLEQAKAAAEDHQSVPPPSMNPCQQRLRVSLLLTPMLSL